VAPPLGSLKQGFQISPLATGDIGHNTISGITYTDAIDLGVSATRVFMMRSALQEVVFTPGVTYETDREFDRDNLLATTDFRFNFAHLYSLQSTKSLQNFMRHVQVNPSLTPDQEEIPFWGYALDFHFGTETGGALVDTTVKATTRSATQLLPAYSIVRMVEQMHGQLQLGPVSFDCSVTGRYLTSTENTVAQLPNNHLVLEHVRGWRGYGVLAATFKPDVESASFREVVSELNSLKSDLAAIRYYLLLKAGSVQSATAKAESDYSAAVEETFEKFRRDTAVVDSGTPSDWS
jgi:hypothetical protein